MSYLSTFINEPEPTLPKIPNDFIKSLLNHKNNPKHQWNVSDIDLEKDKQDWKNLSPQQKIVTLVVLSQFLHGEENVARDIEPVLHLREREGKTDEADFIRTFIEDEKKHAEFFQRYFDEVINDPTIDLAHYRLKNYSALFDKALPKAMNRLNDESLSDTKLASALVKAFITYNLVCEGVIAKTAYDGIMQAFKEQNILPGLCQGLRHINTDEARHIAYGVMSIRNIIGEYGDTMKVLALTKFASLIPRSLATVQEIFKLEKPFPFEKPTLKGLIKNAWVHSMRRLKSINVGTQNAIAESAIAEEEK